MDVLRASLRGKRVLLAMLSDLAHTSRANRLHSFLKSCDCELHVMSADPARGEEQFQVLPRPGLRAKVVALLRLLLGQHDDYLRKRWEIEPGPKDQYDIVVCHDILLLPYIRRNLAGARLIVDLREYYPEHFEHDWFWRLTFGRLNHFVCHHYLSNDDANRTVSEGLRELYLNEYSIEATVAPSYADYHNLQPSPVDEDHITLVHHGNASPNRRLENMIRMMAHLEDRFYLHLYLVKKDERYYRELKEMSSASTRVTLHEPVPFTELITELNRYDIGLFLAPPATSNLDNSLPNKIFEYMQARLAVVVSPLSEMKSFFRDAEFGVVAQGETPAEHARAIETIPVSAISRMKGAADRAAKLAHSDHYIALMLG